VSKNSSFLHVFLSVHNGIVLSNVIVELKNNQKVKFFRIFVKKRHLRVKKWLLRVWDLFSRMEKKIFVNSRESN